MGCLVNPVSVRLGISKFWVSRSWFSKKNYSVFLFRDLLLYNYLFSFFYLLDSDKYFFKFKLADISIHRVSEKAFVNLFFQKDDTFKTFDYKPFVGYFNRRLNFMYRQKRKEKFTRFFSELFSQKVYRPFFFNKLARDRKSVV